MKPQKLTKTDFFDVYGISLILKDTWDDKTKEFLAFILNPIAQKYFEISHYAVLAELRYFRRGSHSDNCDINPANVALLKTMGIKNWMKERKTLSIAQATFLLEHGEWDFSFGGHAWTKISKTTEKLASVLPVGSGNIKEAITIIDTLNDLEHNNALYLETYCTFDLSGALDEKHGRKPSAILKNVSKEVRDMYKEIVQ